MTKERKHDGVTDSNDRQCASYRLSRLGDGRDRARTGGRRGRLGIAAASLSAGPALVGEAVVAFFGENQMIEEGDAEEVASFTQPFGQDAIFWARSNVSR